MLNDGNEDSVVLSPIQTDTTTDPVIPAAPSFGEENADENITNHSPQPDSEADHEDKNADEDRAARREAGKIKQLQDERNRLDEEKQLVVNAFQDVLKSDPNVYEKFRQEHLKKTGEDLGEYNRRYGPTATQPTQAQQPSNSGVQQQAITPQNLGEYIDAITEEKDAFKQLTEAIPDLHPDTIKGDKEKVKEASRNYSFIREAAGQMKALNPKLSLAQAMIAQARILYGKSEDDVAKAREEGQLAGRASALAQGASMSSGSGGQKAPSRKVMSAEDSSVARMLGLDKDSDALKTFQTFSEE